MRVPNWKLLGLLIAATCLIATAAVAVEAEDVEAEDGKTVEIIVNETGECEDGEADCDNERRMVFIGGHGHHGLHGGHHASGGGFLGIQMTELTSELRGHFGVPSDAGVMVSKVVEDSPASRAGLEVGDIVSAVDGEATSSGRALARAVRGHEDGEAVTLEIWRDGKMEILTASLEERASPRHKRACAHHRGDGAGKDFSCGGAENCEVRIECDDDGDCDCTVNGEAADCDQIHGHGDE